MSSGNKNRFISSFPVCISSISFSCLIALVRTPSVMFKSGDDKGQPQLVPNLSGKTSTFSISKYYVSCLAVDFVCVCLCLFVCVFFNKLTKFPSVPSFLKVFIINGYWILTDDFSVSIEMIM